MSPLIGELERAFRHGMVYPVLRTFMRNERVSLPIDISQVKRILLLRYDRLGDVVVTSSFVRRLREWAPSVMIGMVTSRGNQPAADLLEGVDAFHVIGGSVLDSWRALRDARARRYDLVINLVFNRTTSGGLIANFVAPQGIKVGQGADKYRFYFNAMASLDRGTQHMADVLRSLGMQTFGASFATDDLRYSLRDDPIAVERVESFLQDIGSRPILINVSAGDPVRIPSAEQVHDLVTHLLRYTSHSLVIVSSPGQESLRSSLVAALNDPRVVAFPRTGSSTFAEIVALMRRCTFLVTPDTSFVHIAGATATPVLGLYTTDFTLAEWGPRNTVAEIVQGVEGRPLSELSSRKIIEGCDRLIQRIHA